MRILLAVVHHWNPEGNGRHGSLRKDPRPRLHALQDQLLALQRLSTAQGLLNIGERRVDDANEAIRHDFVIKLITDGQHSVLDQLEEPYRALFEEVPTTPLTSKHLGFEAQRVLHEHLDQGFDLYGYLEDDLLIQDPFFFHKIFWFQHQLGSDHLLLPHRMELFWKPDQVNKFYIDGPMAADELQALIPTPPPSIGAPTAGGTVVFSSPSNPHAGCFFLSAEQLRHWGEQPWFLDGDCSLISPLESAATLGLLKTFRLYKPDPAYAGFLEIQHWGTSFRSLIGQQITPRDANPTIDEGAPTGSS